MLMHTRTMRWRWFASPRHHASVTMRVSRPPPPVPRTLTGLGRGGEGGAGRAGFAAAGGLGATRASARTGASSGPELPPRMAKPPLPGARPSTLQESDMGVGYPDALTWSIAAMQKQGSARPSGTGPRQAQDVARNRITGRAPAYRVIVVSSNRTVGLADGRASLY